MSRGATGIHKDNEPQDVFISSFYQQFITDLQNTKEEVIIKSPYLTLKRLNPLLHIFDQLKSKCMWNDIRTYVISENDLLKYKK